MNLLEMYRFTDPVVLTNIELTDIGSVNQSDTDIIELHPPACNCIFRWLGGGPGSHNVLIT